MKSKLITFMLVIGMCNANYAQVKNDVYYFAVGSGHYSHDPTLLEADFAGLNNVPAAVESTHRVKTLFDSNGAIGGEILISEEETFNFITRKKLFEGLKDALENAKAKNTPNLLFVFYYCGHGFTNGELEAMFIPPGDLHVDPSTLDSESWLNRMISPIEIREIIEDAEIPYMIIMDCCYEGEEKPLERMNPTTATLMGLDAALELEDQVIEIVRSMNRMIGPDPVLFSTLSGNFVETVKFPFTDGNKEVGPLCRRMHIVYQKLENLENFTLMDFMYMMQSDELDSITHKGVSYWYDQEENAWNYLRK